MAMQQQSHNLVGSDRVEGAAVCGVDRERIGSIERVMVDKLSGKVAYAVLSYGGFSRARRRSLSDTVVEPEV